MGLGDAAALRASPQSQKLGKLLTNVGKELSPCRVFAVSRRNRLSDFRKLTSPIFAAFFFAIGFGIELFLVLQLSLVHSGDPFWLCREMLADLSNFQPVKVRLAKNCEVA
jgi:hypothetical protein